MHKALILAAGKGIRLYPLTKDLPKCLLKVGNKTILEHLLENFSNAGIKEAVIVVGYKKELIRNLVGNDFNGMKITYCENKHFDKFNVGTSILCAKEHLDCPFIQSHADIIFHPEVIKKVLSSEKENAIIINSDPNVFVNDGNRVILDGNKVITINKEIPKEESKGRAFGLYKFSKEASKVYLDNLKNIFQEENTSFEPALRKTMNNINFNVIDTKEFPFAEIDDERDLIEAHKKIKDIVG